MPYRWPADRFALWELDVVDPACPSCGRMMHICDHRDRRIHTLEGPVQLVCKLNHCPDRHCPGHAKTKSPELEATIAPPSWAIGWDVFCWIGHRRCARHMPARSIRCELLDDYAITLSDDAIAKYIRRYQAMLAVRQQDPEALRREYESVDEIVLSIDGLQPEKGHETLDVVRELTRKRVWFAEALISATNDEVRRLIAQAKAWAESLNTTVGLWISDKQDAFVTGIAAEFPGVPHRYCDNHFLRDLAKPVSEADSHAKVQMRRKARACARSNKPCSSVRGRRCRRAVRETIRRHRDDDRGAGESPAPGTDPASVVVLDDGAAVAESSMSDQGGPLQPPGLRMAEALNEVRESIHRNLGEKRGFAEKQLGRLAGCIDRGLDHVRAEQEPIRQYVKDVEEVAATLEPGAEKRRGPPEEVRGIDRSIRADRRSDSPAHDHADDRLPGRPLRRRGGSSRRSRTTSIWSAVPLAQEPREANPRSPPRGDRHRPRRADISSRSGRTLPIPGDLPPMICCRIAQPENHLASVRRRADARS